MMPDRTNYEIWFIDWLDGRLNGHQVRQLQDFLDQNPDLREEFNALAPVKLKPADITYAQKERLRKKATDLLPCQFEYLCIADLENDLTPGQAEELREVVGVDPERRYVFDLIHRLKLAHSDINYKHKSRLKRVSVYRKVFRISIGVLSAAAAVALFLIINSPATVNIQQPEIPIAQIIIPPAITEASVAETTDPVIHPALKAPGPAPAVSGTIPEIIPDIVPDFPRLDLSPVALPMQVNIAGRQGASSSLIPYDSDFVIPLFFDERNNVNRFFAKFFHERIMRDTTAGDRPVKAYEIAEAGIAGLNKLFGTELALQKNTDEKGEVRSVYFSSRLLKFNAPVKKSETFQ